MNCLPSWSNSVHSDIQRGVVLFFFSVDNVRHTSGYFFYRKLYNGGNYSTFWQNKTNFYTILTTNLYDKSQTKVPDLYDNIYIDNIQKAVVICLIIPTTFPFDAGSSVTSEKCIIFVVQLYVSTFLVRVVMSSTIYVYKRCSVDFYFYSHCFCERFMFYLLIAFT